MSSTISQPLNKMEFDRHAGKLPRQQLNVFRLLGRFLLRRYLSSLTSWKRIEQTVISFFPIIDWLPKYSLRDDFLSDLIGGLTVGIMHIPQGIAYASLAGVHAVNGLYASFFAPLFYMISGTSKHASIGTFAVVALMAGAVVIEHCCPEEKEQCGEKKMIYSPSEVASTLTFLIGIIQLFLGFFGFSFMISYFSDELISGFTTGASMHVITTQVKDLLGIRPPRAQKNFQLPINWYNYFVYLQQTNCVTLGLSVVILTVLVIGKYVVNPFVQKRLKFFIPVPFELLVVIGGTLVSYYFDLEKEHGVQVVGDIPIGMPAPVLPTFSLMPILLPDAFSISIVVIAIHISLAKIFAKKFQYTIQETQEFYALGLSACLSGLFPVYPLSSSLSRTFVNVAAGTRSQLSAVFSSALILSLCLFAGKYLKPLPLCVLAAIIVIALINMFGKFKELKRLWRVSKVDMAIWLVSFGVTVVVNVVVGLTVSITFALFTTVLRLQWASLTTLGESNGLFCDEERYKCVETINGVRIVRFNAPLIFPNAEKFQEVIRNVVNDPEDDEMIQVVVLDCSSFVYSDVMGVSLLIELVEELKVKGIEMLFAATTDSFYDLIDNIDETKKIPRTCFFPSLKEAVSFANFLSTTKSSSNSSPCIHCE